MRFVLFGGEDVKSGNCAHIHKKYIKHKRILVVPWSSDDVKKNGYYRKIIREYFHRLGARSVQFIEKGEREKTVTQKFDYSEIIYLPGGYTEDLLYQIRKRPYFLKLLKEYKGIIVGNSAGSNAIARRYVEYDAEPYELREGLGLANVTVIVHYNEEKEEQLKELEEEERVSVKRISESEALII